MICAICGNIINGNISKDHVFPRAIWKWQAEYLEEEDLVRLKRAIESSANIVKTHHSCNMEKEDAFVDISKLHLSEKSYNKLKSVELIVSDYLNGYEDRKALIYDRQAGKCFVCGENIGIHGVLRRIDKKGKRTEENGCVICHTCNQKSIHII